MRRLRYRLLSLFLMLMILATPTTSGQEVMSNESVIKLHAAGLPATVILNKIRASQTDFDTSVDGLIALAEAGIPEEVIAEMTGAPAPAPAAPAPSGPAVAPQTVIVRQGASAVSNVATRFDGTPCAGPGIFVEGTGGVRELDPSTYTQAKSGGHFMSAITYGIKSVKSKAVIQGTSSMSRLASGSPTFYFCFEEAETGLSYETKGATNPSEFLLVQFTVDHKKRNRWFVAGKLSIWAGSQSGAPPKALRNTSHEKLVPGVYRVTPESILAPGEYGFYYAGSAPMATYGGGGNGGKKIFTFGVGG